MNQQQESEVTLALEAELQNNKMLRDFDSKHQGNLGSLDLKTFINSIENEVNNRLTSTDIN